MLTPSLIALVVHMTAASLTPPAVPQVAAAARTLNHLALPWPAIPTPGAEPRFEAGGRAVSTWQAETMRALAPAPLAAAAIWLGAGRPVVTRCVKLNNPWCIKRARWPGELGGDDEGHTAFARLDDGADAAARLLRSYYVAFGRHSALDIVRRWAPAECGVAGGALPGTLAVKGIAMTLRARFLASHIRGGGMRLTGVRAPGRARGRVRVSVVPLRPLPGYRVPDIAAGLGERRPDPVATASAPIDAAPARVARRPAPTRVVSARPRPAAAPVERIDIAGAAPACGGDEARISNYAARIAGSVGVGASDDLKLFDGEGHALANLPAVMLAMSSVELGYLYADPSLIEGAVRRLALLSPAPAAPAPGAEHPASP